MVLTTSEKSLIDKPRRCIPESNFNQTVISLAELVIKDT